MLENLTPYGAAEFPSVSHDGQLLSVICVAARYTLPEPRVERSAGVLQLATTQSPPPLQDVYWGDPASSSLRHEAQNAWARRGVDVYLNGTAHARQHHPVDSLLVTLSVGALSVSVAVIGDRVWHGSGEPRISAAKKLVSMPLVYERSFGGSARSTDGQLLAQEARNPVGVGFHPSASDARDKPLPNLEQPNTRITRWSDRPAPAGFGAVARSWQPRVAWAGTFNQGWVDTRAPLWPLDFDLRHLSAAASGLSLPGPLSGGERVVLSGCSPYGMFAFALPTLRLRLRSVRAKQADRLTRLVCDALLIEPDESSLTLFFRAALPASQPTSARDVDVLRELASWEDD